MAVQTQEVDSAKKLYSAADMLLDIIVVGISDASKERR